MALESHAVATAEDEWAVLEPLIEAVEGVGTDPKRGGGLEKPWNGLGR